MSEQPLKLLLGFYNTFEMTPSNLVGVQAIAAELLWNSDLEWAWPVERGEKRW
jgi:hypothetical protein